MPLDPTATIQSIFDNAVWWVMALLISQIPRLYAYVFKKKPKREFVFFMINLLISVCLVTGYVSLARKADVPKIKTEAFTLHSATVDEKLLIGCELAAYNAGSPTIFRDWTLEIISPNSPTLKFQAVRLHTDIPLLSKAGTTNAVIRASETFPPLATTEPLQRGAGIRGFAVFSLGNRDQRALMATPGTLFRVSFRDVADHSWVCDWAITTDVRKAP